jgi:hypothetical protein
MPPEQQRKFFSWLGFSVGLPLIVYPTALLICLMRGVPNAFVELLAKGDQLFLAVILLAVSVDWSAQDLLLTPRTQVTAQTSAYASLIVNLLVLIFTVLVYGWVLTLGIFPPPAEERPDQTVMAVIWTGWLIATVLMCAFHYRRLL